MANEIDPRLMSRIAADTDLPATLHRRRRRRGGGTGRSAPSFLAACGSEQHDEFQQLVGGTAG